MVQFSGKYKQTKEEHYEDFLKAMGLGIVLRKVATATSPTVTISEEGPNKWKIVSAVVKIAEEEKFEFGKTFDEETIDGRKVTTTWTLEGDKWVQVQKNKKAGGPDCKVTRVFSNQGIEVTYETTGVTAKCYFQRLN